MRNARFRVMYPRGERDDPTKQWPYFDVLNPPPSFVEHCRQIATSAQYYHAEQAIQGAGYFYSVPDRAYIHPKHYRK